MAFSLDRVLKALLFGASGPLSIKDIQKVFTKFHEQSETLPEEEPAVEEEEGSECVEAPFLEAEGMPTSDVPSLVTASQIREAVDRISAGLEEHDEVYRLMERHNGFVLVTAPNIGEWIRLLRDEPRPMKLSQSALETLAVIAYRQPVIRSEVEKIRGVSIDSALSRLLEREFVQVVGRADLPGRPIQYGTSETFLEFVGVRSIEELPASDVLSPRQIDEWLHEVSNQHDVTEKEMGLPEGERVDREKEVAVEESVGETIPDSEVAADGESEVESLETEVVSPKIEAENAGEETVSEEGVTEDVREEVEDESEKRVNPVS
ncbi:MAG: SMC-Scp complex subunit ScpB [Opitutales bacterium]|nr:SMC-Scp complex subunit ScpB [Opitutales bacterium]MBT5813460.1 SMC-Scp complex subunit ScpB [Opitutales bacterium]MBT6380125.1 SMC-Scp complex subunit ScpB [Opitutales bacterium]